MALYYKLSQKLRGIRIRFNKTLTSLSYVRTCDTHVIISLTGYGVNKHYELFLIHMQSQSKQSQDLNGSDSKCRHAAAAVHQQYSEPVSNAKFTI